MQALMRYELIAVSGRGRAVTCDVFSIALPRRGARDVVDNDDVIELASARSVYERHKRPAAPATLVKLTGGRLAAARGRLLHGLVARRPAALVRAAWLGEGAVSWSRCRFALDVAGLLMLLLLLIGGRRINR